MIHVRDEMLKKATVNMNEVFQQRTEECMRKKSICKSFMIVLALMPFVLRISVRSLK